MKIKRENANEMLGIVSKCDKRGEGHAGERSIKNRRGSMF